ncbi:MAG: antitoxin family protein [Nitrospirae bacterium]|nr:antitoxin family protein [Nitrospirota bacterium]
MPKTIQAVYKNGVLKPTRKLPFRDSQKVTLKIVSEEPSPQPPRRRAHPALPIVGIFDGPRDLSRDPDRYLWRDPNLSGP